MTEIIRFETNIARSIRLRYAAGKETEGQYGVQYYHQVLPSGAVYLSPVVEQKIAELGIRDGETVEICKKEVKQEGGKPRIEWQVARISNPEQSGSRPTAPETARVSQGGSTSQAQNTPAKLPMDRAMTAFLILAGRSTREAEKVLGAEGGSVRFDSRDVAALATTLLIQSAREGWLTWIAPAAEPDPVTAPEPYDTGGNPPNTKAAQEYVVERKLAQYATGSRPWANAEQKNRAFDALREAVGETRFFEELRLEGVEHHSQIRSYQKAVDLYNRLCAIANLQREVA